MEPNTGAPETSRNAWQLLWRVLVEPGQTFTRVVANPRPLTAVLILCSINLGLTLLTAPKLQAYALRALEKAATGVPAGDLGAIKTVVAATAVASAATTSVVAPLLWWLILAGLLYGFGAATGHRAPLGTLYTVAAYAYPPVIAGNAVQTALILTHPVDSMTHLSTSLAAFLPEGTKGPLFNFMLQIDPFGLWSLGLAALGGAVALGTEFRRTAALLFGLWLAYACLVSFAIFPLTQR